MEGGRGEYTSVPYDSTFCLPSLKVFSSWTSTSTTPLAPSLAKDTAIALPSPRAPPVMKATPGARGPERFDMVYARRQLELVTVIVIGR